MADKAFVVKNSLVVNTNLLFANNGKVGIGTATPDAVLTVNGTANVSGSVQLSNTLNTTGAAVFANTATFTGNVTFSNTVNFVGGITTANLQITGNVAAVAFIMNGSPLGNASLKNIASTADILANTAGAVVTVDALNGTGAYVTLTDASTININMANGANFSVTIGGNRTLAKPTNLIIGRTTYLEIIQDGTGNHTMSYDPVFKPDTGTMPNIDLVAGHKTILALHPRSANVIFLSMPYIGVQ